MDACIQYIFLSCTLGSHKLHDEYIENQWLEDKKTCKKGGTFRKSVHERKGINIKLSCCTGDLEAFASTIYAHVNLTKGKKNPRCGWIGPSLFTRRRDCVRGRKITHFSKNKSPQIRSQDEEASRVLSLFAGPPSSSSDKEDIKRC